MKRKATALFSAAIGTLGICNAVQAAPLLTDTFTYNDGPIETVSGGLWEINSGSGSKLVTGGKFLIDDNTTSDYQRQFTGGTSTTVYSSFKLNMSATDVPNSVGAYFAALSAPKTGTAFSTLFRARVGALVTGAEPAGQFTLGIHGSSSTVSDYVTWATPLSFGTEYLIVTKYDGLTGENRLWVNPTLESDLSVLQTSATSSTGMGAYLWRSSSSATDGDKLVDDLNAGTLFADVVGGGVVPEPTTAGALAAAGVAAMLRRRRSSK